MIGERSLNQRESAGLRIFMKQRSQKPGVSIQKKTQFIAQLYFLLTSVS